MWVGPGLRQQVLGVTIPWLAVFPCISRLTKPWVKSINIIPLHSLLWFLPCLNFCVGVTKWWTVIRTFKPNQPVPSQVAFGHGLYHRNRKQTRTMIQDSSYLPHTAISMKTVSNKINHRIQGCFSFLRQGFMWISLTSNLQIMSCFLLFKK